jgi:hypothetical protein
MAAQRAISVYAYGEAVRLLEQALKVQRVLNPDDKAKLCDLLITQGEYLITAGEPQRAFTMELQEAYSLAEAGGDRDSAARASSLAMRGAIYHGGGRLLAGLHPKPPSGSKERTAVPNRRQRSASGPTWALGNPKRFPACMRDDSMR